jgi:hypothetical protein
MATKKAKPKQDEPKDDPKDEQVTDQAQSGSEAGPDVNVKTTNEAFEAAQEQGFFGVSASTYANKEYSQETDPTKSPRHDRAAQADFDELREAKRKETTKSGDGD